MKSVEDYKNSRNSVSVKYTEFNSLKTRFPNHFFAFYEGKDAPYFYSKLKQYLPDMEISPIQCNGKSMVKKMYLSCHNKNALEGISTGFFIDRDFDKNDEVYVLNNFYVTDRYAIENYYTSDICVSKILKNEFGINEANPDFDTIINRYRIFQEAYHKSTSLFNAWFYTIKNNGCNCEVCLDEKLPKNFLVYNFEDWTVMQNYDLDMLNNLYSAKSSIVSKKEVLDNVLRLETNPLHAFRGKYELTCLVDFMLKIQEQLKEGIGELTKNPYKNQITNHQVLSMWAQYADEDDKLKDYMKSRIHKSIGKYTL